MSDFFSKLFYGNTVQQWLIALGIMVLAVIVGKILHRIIGGVVKKLTAKTKTRLDDIIVDMVEEPFIFGILILGIWIGLGTLSLGDGAKRFADHVFYFLITFNVAWLIVRIFDSLIKEYLVPLVSASESDLDDQLLPIIRKGVKAVIWVVAIIVGANNAGYDVGAIIAGLGIGGLAFALAAQDTVGNLFGGVTIFLDKPFNVNQRVKIAGFDGTITEIGLRSTRLKTLENRIVTIPNSTFTDNPVENVSSEPSRKVVLNLGLTYDTDANQMELGMKLLRDIAAANPDLEENVVISFNSFGDFALGILFIYYIKSGSDIMGVQSAINLEILRRFGDHKLDFAFPTQTIYAHVQKEEG